MNVVANFGLGAKSVKVACTATPSAALAVPVASDGGGNNVRISNIGPNQAYVRFAPDNTVVAAIPGATFGAGTDLTVLNGQSVIFQRNPTAHAFLSAVCEATQTATLLVEVGDGSL
jgi:hypothetical protein